MEQNNNILRLFYRRFVILYGPEIFGTVNSQIREMLFIFYISYDSPRTPFLSHQNYITKCHEFIEYLLSSSPNFILECIDVDWRPILSSAANTAKFFLVLLQRSNSEDPHVQVALQKWCEKFAIYSLDRYYLTTKQAIKDAKCECRCCNHRLSTNTCITCTFQKSRCTCECFCDICVASSDLKTFRSRTAPLLPEYLKSEKEFEKTSKKMFLALLRTRPQQK
jgi:hypothetical protein